MNIKFRLWLYRLCWVFFSDFWFHGKASSQNISPGKLIDTNYTGCPKNSGISVIFNVSSQFFCMTVNFTLNIENGLCLEDILKSIEHNRKIRNYKKSREKVCKAKNVQQLHLYALTIFYWALTNKFWDIAQKSTNFTHFFAFQRFLYDRFTWELEYCYNIAQHKS